jgi:hydrogenase-4 component H
VIVSKLKEAVLCFGAGRVTLPYPFQPHDPEQTFRGQPDIDVDKCVGCGACANACPSRLIRIVDLDQSRRRIVRLFERCIYCGRCEDVCPEDAITMSARSELASDLARQDLVHESEIFMATCQRCGRCYEPDSPLDRLMRTGFRSDQVRLKPRIPGEEE